MKTLGTMVVAVALAAPALAQQRVDERRPASPDGTVEIECPSVDVRVVGWDKNEVQVTGTLGAQVGPLDIRSSGKTVKIETETSHPGKSDGELEIRVPARSRLRIESFAGGIAVSDVSGDVRAESVQGGITVKGAAGEINAETVNGGVEVSGPSRSVHAETVNGSVTIQGASGEVSASAVAGGLTVSGTTFKRVKLESVSGSVRFDGGLEKNGQLDAEAVSGTVELLLPAGTNAEVSISNFSGEIKSEFDGAAKGADEGRHEVQARELRLVLGTGGARISVETMSGSVLLRKK